MLATRKKSPATTSKKKALSSTKARTGVGKPTKKGKATSANDGSYLQQFHPSTHEVVSTVNKTTTHDSSQLGISASSGQVIIEMLQKLDASNQALAKRIDHIERQGSFSSTSMTSPTSQHPLAARHIDIDRTQANASTTQLPTGIWSQLAGMNTTTVPLTQPTSTSTRVQTQISHDGIAPKLEVMRSTPSISTAVSQLLARYEEQADQEARPGKTYSYRKRSGRYNVTATSTVGPQYRWPNERLVSNSHTKKPAYDELSLAQWISGQLNNILLVEDNSMLRSMLTQVSMAMRDAVSLPWPAVRSACAASMTDVEEGRLNWADSLQWSLNRISNSQLAVLNSNSAGHNGQKSKICKFYNEGNCSNENHHGIYKHYCMNCYKQGRSLMHPEIRCSSRNSNRNQDQGSAMAR